MSKGTPWKVWFRLIKIKYPDAWAELTYQYTENVSTGYICHKSLLPYYSETIYEAGDWPVNATPV